MSDARAAHPRSLAMILHDLGEACLCQETQFPRCLFCEAREQLEAQDRTLRLAQADLAKVRTPARSADERLDRVLRDVAGNLRSLITDNSTTQVDQLLRDSSELIRVLARMATGGKTLYQAFGAPGDWGYETPIGSALNALYSQPRQSDER